MITQTISAAEQAAEQAKKDGLRGLYPSAVIVAIDEVNRLRRRLVILKEMLNSAPGCGCGHCLQQRAMEKIIEDTLNYDAKTNLETSMAETADALCVSSGHEKKTGCNG